MSSCTIRGHKAQSVAVSHMTLSGWLWRGREVKFHPQPQEVNEGREHRTHEPNTGRIRRHVRTTNASPLFLLRGRGYAGTHARLDSPVNVMETPRTRHRFAGRPVHPERQQGHLSLKRHTVEPRPARVTRLRTQSGRQDASSGSTPIHLLSDTLEAPSCVLRTPQPSSEKVWVRIEVACS